MKIEDAAPFLRVCQKIECGSMNEIAERVENRSERNTVNPEARQGPAPRADAHADGRLIDHRPARS